MRVKTWDRELLTWLGAGERKTKVKGVAGELRGNGAIRKVYKPDFLILTSFLVLVELTANCRSWHHLSEAGFFLIISLMRFVPSLAFSPL